MCQGQSHTFKKIAFLELFLRTIEEEKWNLFEKLGQLRTPSPRYPRGMFGAVDAGEETTVQFFTEWVEQVKAEIPADRLLVFEVKQGWGPLCEFLSVPVPEEPFPNVNDTKNMQHRIWSMKKQSLLLWTGAVIGFVTALYCMQNVTTCILL